MSSLSFCLTGCLQVRVGDVGGNTLGFYGAVFDPTADTIVGHDYQGSLHVWNYQVGFILILFNLALAQLKKTRMVGV